MDDNSENLVPALVAGNQLGRPVKIEGVPFAIIPETYCLRDLEKTLPAPHRERGDFRVATAEAFNATVSLLRRVDPERLPIFYSRGGTTATVKAVLNFYSWRDLTVTLTQELSTPFLDWYRLSTVSQPQRKFALFLEERTEHVVKPDGAALLELARKFKANVAVRFQSCIEQENGDASLEFIQTTDAGSAGAKGRMKVPNFITLFMPVWHGGAPVKFDARFAYTIADDGKLSLAFEILNVNELLTRELRKVVLGIAKENADSVAIEGSNSTVPSL